MVLFCITCKSHKHYNSALIEKVPVNKNANGTEPDSVMVGFCFGYSNLLSRP